MSKYLVETYYTCTFKVNHYLENIDEKELKNLEKRDDGEFEILDVKLDNRKTKSLDPNNNKVLENKNINIFSENKQNGPKKIEKTLALRGGLCYNVVYEIRTQIQAVCFMHRYRYVVSSVYLPSTAYSRANTCTA